MSASNDYGLTDDGDFANADDRYPSASSTTSSSNNNMGTAIGSQGVGNMLFNEALLQSGRVDLGVGPTKRYRDFRGNDVIPKVDPQVRQWLMETLPALNARDLQDYAEGLTKLGFLPSMLCELKEGDLDFMKEEHRRYLYKEIMGEDTSEF
eukprot:CAMPEP_0183733368 /NCGR_PEP_ID=MMETSP0737-20130205/40989_1 /TAXON_ID=385413 /ORGANISM="Thalassiosira miniscula, Strain CCMP1093" /LENGTH=150 /DNA_ID=CAMNT_0025966609 /DNA_START=175 /DNA_END=627 /DNA_ORIENTATION=-